MCIRDSFYPRVRHIFRNELDAVWGKTSIAQQLFVLIGTINQPLLLKFPKIGSPSRTSHNFPKIGSPSRTSHNFPSRLVQRGPTSPLCCKSFRHELCCEPTTWREAGLDALQHRD